MSNQNAADHRATYVAIFVGAGTVLGIIFSSAFDAGALVIGIGLLFGLAAAGLYLFLDRQRQ